jgi:outer membrane protein TolC
MYPAHKVLLAFLLVPSVGFSASLSLQDYLSQVENQHQNITAGKILVEAADERKDEAKLIFRPSIFVQAQTSVDEKPISNVPAQGNRTDYDYGTVGILQQFDFGLKGQLSYNLAHTKVYNTNPTFFPNPEFHDGIARLELTQSLWRNWGGKETRAQETIIDSQTKASKHTENFKMKSVLANAESAYWILSQSQKVVKVQTENLNRAKKLVSWNQRRSNTGLGDRSDTLQAQSNLKLREFEVERTLQNQIDARRLFNSFRGVNSDAVVEELDSSNLKGLLSLTPPKRAELRDDVRAAQELSNISKANSQLAIERNKPLFEVYGSRALNGRDFESSQAVSNSFTNDHPTTAVGLRFTAPLDFGTTSNAVSSYKKEQAAADLNFQRKLFDQDREWNDLIARFEDAKTRLKLLEDVVEIQKIKLTNETNRLSNGRTTTFQVLNFENDFANSELSRIFSETDLLNLYSQMKIYNAGDVK